MWQVWHAIIPIIYEQQTQTELVNEILLAIKLYINELMQRYGPSDVYLSKSFVLSK